MSEQTTSRGGWWVVGQFVILAVILIVGYFDSARTSSHMIAQIIGVLLGGLALIMVVLAFSHLGRNLTPFPKPLADGELITHGIYAFVRHPIYVSLICGSLAYSIYVGSWLAGIGCVVLAIWFDQKAAREEAFLRAKFADYAVYSNKVAKFIPKVY
ncbi:MAG: methyltransferase family protein [Roseiflexaceae bacterium]